MFFLNSATFFKNFIRVSPYPREGVTRGSLPPALLVMPLGAGPEMWNGTVVYPLRPLTWQDFLCCCYSETTQCIYDWANGHYAVQGHSRSLILVGLPIEPSYIRLRISD